MKSSDIQSFIENLPDKCICESCGNTNYNHDYITFLHIHNSSITPIPDFFERLKNRCPTCFSHEKTTCIGCGISYLSPTKTISNIVEITQIFCASCNSLRYALKNGEKYYYKLNSDTSRTSLPFVPGKLLQIKYSIFMSRNIISMPYGFKVDNQNDSIFLGNATVNYPLLENVNQNNVDSFFINTLSNPINYYITRHGTVCGGSCSSDCNHSPITYVVDDISILEGNDSSL